MAFDRSRLLLLFASVVSAQYGPGGQYGPNNHPGPDGNDGGDDDDGPYGFGGYNSYGNFFADGQTKIIAHGVLAALAFVILFPMGSILIRLASFRGLWWVHGLWQVVAYIIYIAAFALGVSIVNSVPVNLLDHYHPIIGIVVFVLLFFQPILGVLHHTKFKKYNRRTVWSYGHLWLGRIVITLGIINGGLGLLFATETGRYEPSKGAMIAYGVVAGIMWLLWITSSVVGERRRARAKAEAAKLQDPPPYKYAHKEQFA